MMIAQSEGGKDALGLEKMNRAADAINAELDEVLEYQALGPVLGRGFRIRGIILNNVYRFTGH
jgi:hypothetical protein